MHAPFNPQIKELELRNWRVLLVAAVLIVGLGGYTKPASASVNPSASDGSVATRAVVGTAAKAASLNRCGDNYVRKTRPVRAFYDDYRPAIERLRIRFIYKSGSLRVCPEFLRTSPYFQTRQHTIVIKDTRNGPAKMICGALHCKWKDDDRRTTVNFSYRYKLKGDEKWKRNEGAVVLVIAG